MNKENLNFNYEVITIIYIKELSSLSEVFSDTTRIPNFLKKVSIAFLKLTNTVIIKENIAILPYSSENLKKLSSRKLQKYFKKINKLMSAENIQTIALSNALNNLDNIQELKNSFYSRNYNILDGRWLFKHLSFEILEYISEEKNIRTNEMEVSILTNTYSDFIKENIRLLAQNIKNLNIVTPNIELFKPLTQELYNSFGISIRISNNKKKILTHSHVIFNFDFPEVVLNKFTLPLNGILINYNEKIKLKSKLFNGLNVSYYTINVHKELIDNFKNDYLLETFDLEILYESLYFGETSFTKVLSHFIDDTLSVASLVGNNGEISNKEYSMS